MRDFIFSVFYSELWWREGGRRENWLNRNYGCTRIYTFTNIVCHRNIIDERATMEIVKLFFTRSLLPQPEFWVLNEICCRRFVDFKFYLINSIWDLVQCKVYEELRNSDDGDRAGGGGGDGNNNDWWWRRTTTATTIAMAAITIQSGVLFAYINIPVTSYICWMI